MDMLKQPLEAYLVHRFGPDTQVLSAKHFSRGSSRLTWFVEYRVTPHTPVTKVIFRSDLLSGSTIPTSLEQEHFMYERLGRTAVPVAKALWWEDDPQWAAMKFYVREQVEGDWNVPHLLDPDPKYDALRIAISKEHLGKLAIVHQVDWQSLDFDRYLPVPAGPADAAHNAIRMAENQMASFQGEPIPIFVEGAAWLRARAPVAPRVSLLKGTNGLGEEVFKDGKIVALSDWEEASLGDPAADIASVQVLIPEIERDGKKLWGMEQALDYYHSVSGIRVSMESIAYYRIFQGLRMVMYSHKAAMGTHDSGANIRQPWTGTEVLYAGKKTLAAAMGLTSPLPVSRFHELNESVEQLNDHSDRG